MLFRNLLIKTVPLLIVCPKFLSTLSNCCITKELLVWFANDAKNILQRPELRWVIRLSIQFYNRLKHKVNVLCLLSSSPHAIKWCKTIESNRSVPNIISLLIYLLIASASCIHLSSPSCTLTSCLMLRFALLPAHLSCSRPLHRQRLLFERCSCRKSCNHLRVTASPKYKCLRNQVFRDTLDI